MHYYIADTHFGHEHIIRLCRRPFLSVEAMDRQMIAAWQAKVSEKDEVFVLGDFAYKNKRSFVSYLEELPGHKHLISGNHDAALLRDARARALFASVETALELRDPDAAVGVFLCHYPMVEWPGYYRGDYHVFGHIHNARQQAYELTRQLERGLNASVEITGYAPLSLRELIEANAAWKSGYCAPS